MMLDGDARTVAGGVETHLHLGTLSGPEAPRPEIEQQPHPRFPCENTADLLPGFQQATRFEAHRAVAGAVPGTALPPGVDLLGEDPEGRAGIRTNHRGHGDAFV